MTQDQANYRRGDPVDHCGVCMFYQGKNRCSKVEGDITPFGISDAYKAVKNPFGATLNGNEKNAIRAMAADASDKSNLGDSNQYSFR